MHSRLLIGFLCFFISLILFGKTPTSLSAEPSFDRRRLDAESKQAFLNLNFFSEGRGMHTVPGLINFYKKISGAGVVESTVRNRWGMNVLSEHQIVGLFDVNYKNMNVAVLGCVACHSSKAAGQFIVGLGNKRVDVYQLGQDLLKIQTLYDKITFFKNSDYKAVEQGALEFASVLANEQIGNYTQGLVPVSFVRTWFYKQAGQSLPKDLTKGAVKIPALWGYGVKRKVGQFSDGFGNGLLPGWAIAVELTAGQTPETVRSYLPKVEQAEEALGNFLPPSYPFAIDANKAAHGRAVFARTCQGCHGSYERDQEGLPIFKEPKWIKIEIVKTDLDRLQSNTEHFKDLVRNNPLKDILQINDFGDGYFAPRLDGIWARFPYLHNASVPNIRALLTSPPNRPQLFSLEDAGEAPRFDQQKVGLTVPSAGSRETIQLRRQANNGDRAIYNVEKTGQSNQGHEFGLGLTEGEKSDLIEYLKTL